MSRYIDADALKKDIARLHCLNSETEIRRAYENNPHSSTTDFEGVFVDVFDIVDETPSIDIVRCAECMWRDKDNQGEYYCMYVKGMADINDDSFCSWGEREGE